MKINAQELQFCRIPIKAAETRLERDWGASGELFHSLLKTEFSRFFPGKIFVVQNQNIGLFYSLCLTTYYALKLHKVINSLKVITLNEIIEEGFKPNVNESSKSIKVLAIIDFGPECDYYQSKKFIIQTFLKEWLDSGKSLILLGNGEITNIKFDTWFISLLKDRVVLKG